MAAYPDRGTAVFLAKLAVESDRYEEAIEVMKSLALMDVEFTTDERNLIAAAYKYAIAVRRASWRALSSIERKEELKENQVNVERIKKYIAKVETEINDICGEIKSILEEHLIPSCVSPQIISEHHVFYYKMVGDSYRYRAEFKTGDEREALAQQAFAEYDTATKIAEQELHVTDPIRLGLALNFSVFYYEICNSLEIAREIAQRAHDDAMAELESLNEEARENTDQILHILTDNLFLWDAAEAEQNTATNAGGDGGDGAVKLLDD